MPRSQPSPDHYLYSRPGCCGIRGFFICNRELRVLAFFCGGSSPPHPSARFPPCNPRKMLSHFSAILLICCGKGLTANCFLPSKKQPSPSVGEGPGKSTTPACRIGNRKSLDLDPPFLASQGSGLRYGSRYPLRNAIRPVGMYVMGSGTRRYASR